MCLTTMERPGSPDSPTKRASLVKIPINGRSRHQIHHNNEQEQIKQHWFETLTTPIQFSVLASGVFFFFGIHNYLQEAIMSVEGFHFGVMLGWLEVFGVTVCSCVERTYIAGETQRVAPLSAYPLLTFCLLSSSSLSNLALNFINFPTKVVFRSCKVSTALLFSQTSNHFLDIFCPFKPSLISNKLFFRFPFVIAR